MLNTHNHRQFLAVGGYFQTTLNRLNMNLDFLNISNPSEMEFKAIANKLFNYFAIQTYDSTYRITEMEFYWNSESHIDESTYHRKYVDPKSGEWFFHYSGVDIALKNETTGGYGGILLRAVYDITHNKLYKGPMVCAMRLFSGTSAFETAIQTKIVQHTFPKVDLSMSPRIGLGKNAMKNDADKLPYRFFITHIR